MGVVVLRAPVVKIFRNHHYVELILHSIIRGYLNRYLLNYVTEPIEYCVANWLQQEVKG